MLLLAAVVCWSDAFLTQSGNSETTSELAAILLFPCPDNGLSHLCDGL